MHHIISKQIGDRVPTKFEPAIEIRVSGDALSSEQYSLWAAWFRGFSRRDDEQGVAYELGAEARAEVEEVFARRLQELRGLLQNPA